MLRRPEACGPLLFRKAEHHAFRSFLLCVRKGLEKFLVSPSCNLPPGCKLHPLHFLVSTRAFSTTTTPCPSVAPRNPYRPTRLGRHPLRRDGVDPHVDTLFRHCVLFIPFSPALRRSEPGCTILLFFSLASSRALTRTGVTVLTLN